MAKRGTSKKGKSTTGHKSKSHRGKRAGGKRGGRSKAAKKSGSSTKKHGAHRRHKQKSPSKFNLFMKTTVSKIKQDHPGLTQKDAFKKAAEQWSTSPDNPKNIH